MNSQGKTTAVPPELVMSKIYLVRNMKVMLDRDLAELYGVETKRLKEAAKRNIERFPEDFMFELNDEEHNNLRSQFATSSWGGVRYTSMAFTEQGVAMLSSILNSATAISVNIQIIRIFTKMRELLSTNQEIIRKLEDLEKKGLEHDDKLLLIFEYLKQLEKAKQNELEYKNRYPIGFKLGANK